MSKESIQGFQTVLANLNREVQQIKQRTATGLTSAVSYLFNDMDTVAPKIPIDTGNLRASWVQNLMRRDMQTIGIRFGFMANYALWVHENVDANFAGQLDKVKFITRGPNKGKPTKRTAKYTRREGAGAKFMEAAINRNHEKILQIIANTIRI